MARHIVIAGPMGAGKTTIGRALARDRGMHFTDSDEALLASTGRNAREIAATDGVPHLHELERRFVVAAMAAASPAVIAAAASIADDRKLLSRIVAGGHLLVMLDVAVPEQRLRDSADHRRPMGDEEARALHRARRDAAVAAGANIVDAGMGLEATLSAIIGLLDPSTPR